MIFSSTIQTLTVGTGVSPVQSSGKPEELRTLPPVGSSTLPRRKYFSDFMQRYNKVFRQTKKYIIFFVNPFIHNMRLLFVLGLDITLLIFLKNARSKFLILCYLQFNLHFNVIFFELFVVANVICVILQTERSVFFF